MICMQLHTNVPYSCSFRCQNIRSENKQKNKLAKPSQRQGAIEMSKSIIIKPLQSHGQRHVNKWPTFVVSLMLIACLVADSMQRWFVFAFADPLWPCVKVRVIKTSMSIYGIDKSTLMPSLNVIAELFCDILQVTFWDVHVALNEGQGHRTGNGHIDL